MTIPSNARSLLVLYFWLCQWLGLFRVSYCNYNQKSWNSFRNCSTPFSERLWVTNPYHSVMIFCIIVLQRKTASKANAFVPAETRYRLVLTATTVMWHEEICQKRLCISAKSHPLNQWRSEGRSLTGTPNKTDSSFDSSLYLFEIHVERRVDCRLQRQKPGIERLTKGLHNRNRIQAIFFNQITQQIALQQIQLQSQLQTFWWRLGEWSQILDKTRKSMIVFF